MASLNSSLRSLLAAALAVSFTGCAGYVTRDEFNSTVSDLRATDQRLEGRMNELQKALEGHEARITQFEGRVHVETLAHFATDDATLREADKPLLDDFARTLAKHHPGVTVTVEGFADPSGSAGYNRRLGQRRADAVRDYLVTQGLSAGQVRAVSYGEDSNRLIHPGATGENGLANRRVALVIDYADTVASR